ncbi:MAG TPA: ATP-binding protein [Candidatus Saccharimonadales bacterium]|nr:ATP-binding protein [Candidatus Saccharimonadales bacterium]
MSKTDVQGNTLLDVRQAAVFLRVNPGTIRRWAQDGRLTGLKIGVRGDWRFTEESLLRLAHANTPHTDKGNDSHNSHDGHDVQFYDDEPYLIGCLKDYVAAALRAGEGCIVIATKDHLRLLQGRLAEEGVDTAAARSEGTCVFLDAHATLGSFMANGMPDAASFEAAIGGLVTEVSQRTPSIRAYGEMVAILWNEGNLPALIRLEELWNELIAKTKLSLLCGYPMKTFDKEGDDRAFSHIGRLHTLVIPAESYVLSEDTANNHRFIASLQQKAEALQREIDLKSQILSKLEDASKSMLAEQERLIALNEAKDEFISIASHQLRTPATGVKQYIGMLLEGYAGRLTEVQENYLAKAYESNERQIAVVNNLLLIAKVDAGKIVLKPAACDLAELVRDVISEQRQEIAKRNQHVEVTMPEELTMHIDGQYMRMVIENLLSNASKYSSDGTAIRIKLKKGKAAVSLSVVDQGVGISKEDQPKLFKKFSRIFNDQSVAEGNGLGLYWSNKIVELHQGALTLESKPGQGSTFTISIPL